jgi:DNA mismatch repair ATPase MutS
METFSNRAEIQKTFTEVRNASYYEKKQPLMEDEKINQLLDSILEFKKSLIYKTGTIYDINERLGKITWYNNLDEECYMLLNDLISSARDLRGSLVRQYISINTLRNKGVAKEEIKDFKNAIDELKETYEDLESVFFFLPKMPDFLETTKKLSLI